ncbi:hypothetical protein LCGC14_2251490 [marine sediment metagenome]|uniref:Uncharacterized protein n=1 Tax=marine sediment metagenome TaxID=412755 RepID=A0A0F9FXH5_9ZZZZ
MSKAENCQKAFEQLLRTCAIDVPALGKRKITPVKRKRAMTGYNCFTKNLYAAEKKTAEREGRKPMSYKQLISMKTWSTTPDKQKGIWNDLATQGCPPVPDPHNVGG